MSKSKLTELAAFTTGIGQMAWQVYCKSELGKRRLIALKTEDERSSAYIIFQQGLGCRVLVPPEADDEMLWQDYLSTQDGKVLLDGPDYPDTPGIILHYAKEFFYEGCRVGKILVRELIPDKQETEHVKQ